MILTRVGDRGLRVCRSADGSAVVLQAVSVRPACGWLAQFGVKST